MFFGRKKEISKAKVYIKEVESEVYDVVVIKLKDTLGHWHETKELTPYLEDDFISKRGEVVKGYKMRVDPQMYFQFQDRIDTTTGTLFLRNVVCYEVHTTKRFFDRVVYKEVKND